MKYEVRIHPKAIKELNRFSDDVQDTVKTKIRALSEEFNKPGSKLDVVRMSGVKKGVQLFRLRVGDHRVVFEFADATIWIARISHRRDSYRGL
jgi:mRNA-degrading endonuclease RelE of RelBE toxin-antitoxin system